MLNKLFPSIFDSREDKRPEKESDIIRYAENALSGLGIYATNSMSEDWVIWEKKMIDDLSFIEEHAKKFSSPHLYTLAGDGWSLFAIWYRRKNDDKTTPLRRAISLLEKSLEIDPYFEKAKVVLGTILVERKQVRDLSRAIDLLNAIRNKSGRIKELINTAKRWIGEIDFDLEVDYQNMQFIPLNFLREERKKCRFLIKKYKKENEFDKLRPVLEHMYRLAMLHDAATYVLLHGDYFIDERKDKAWDKKLKKIASSAIKYSYIANGKILSDEGYLSKNDYKNFELFFGKSTKTFDPIELLDKT